MNTYVQLAGYCLALIAAASLIDITTGSGDMVALGVSIVAVVLIGHVILTENRGDSQR